MDNFVKAVLHCREQLEIHRKRRRLVDFILKRTKGLSHMFLQGFTEQQLFNYYYRLILETHPNKKLSFLRTSLPVEFLGPDDQRNQQ